MIYIPRFRIRTESSITGGYWAYNNSVWEVTTHIAFMIEKPELFNLTAKEINEIFAKYGEKLNIEGKAREELIRMVSKEGWIRIRHYQKPENYWSIQCDDIMKRKPVIKNFLYWAIEHKQMSYNDSAVILSYDRPNDKEVYDWNRGGIKEFLSEKRRNK